MNTPKRIVEFDIPGLAGAITEIHRRYLTPAIEAAGGAQKDRPICPCGMPMVSSTGGWVCPDWFADQALGSDTSKHGLKTDPLVGQEVTLPDGSRGRVRERATDDSNLLFVSLSDGSEKVFSAWELSLIQEDL